VVERSQGTGKRWAEPGACESAEELQGHIDEMDRIQREEYPIAKGRSRWEQYPELRHSGRPYTRRGERQHWDLSRVLDHLSGYAVTRQVGPSGRVWLYNRSYYVGVVHGGKSVYVMLDPQRCRWLFADADGRQLNQQPAKELTQDSIQRLQVTQRPPIPRRRKSKTK